MMKSSKLIQYILIGIGLIVLPLLLQQGGNAWVRILDMALLYVLLALGLNIVVGYAGLLDLGYVAFFAVGAYLAALLGSPHLAQAFPFIAESFPNGLHLPIWLVIPLAAALAGLTRHGCSRGRPNCAACRPNSPSLSAPACSCCSR
mgnify:CR=1 FL=1